MAVNLVVSFYILRVLFKHTNQTFKFRPNEANNNTTIKTVDLPKITSQKESESIQKMDTFSENTKCITSKIDTTENTNAGNGSEKNSFSSNATSCSSEAAERNADKPLAVSGAASTVKFSFTFAISGEMKIDSAVKNPNEQPQVIFNVNTEPPKLSVSLDKDQSHSLKTKSTDNSGLKSGVNPIIDTTTQEAKAIDGSPGIASFTSQIPGSMITRSREIEIQIQVFALAVQNFVQNLSAAMVGSTSVSPMASGSEESIKATANGRSDEVLPLSIDEANKEAVKITNPISASVEDDQKNSDPKFSAVHEDPLINATAKSTASVSDVGLNNAPGFEENVEKPVAIGSRTSAPSLKENNSTPLFTFNTPSSNLVQTKAKPVSGINASSLGKKKSFPRFGSDAPAAVVLAWGEKKTAPALETKAKPVSHTDASSLGKTKWPRLGSDARAALAPALRGQRLGPTVASTVLDGSGQKETVPVLNFDIQALGLRETKDSPGYNFVAADSNLGETKSTSTFNFGKAVPSLAENKVAPVFRFGTPPSGLGQKKSTPTFAPHSSRLELDTAVAKGHNVHHH